MVPTWSTCASTRFWWYQTQMIGTCLTYGRVRRDGHATGIDMLGQSETRPRSDSDLAPSNSDLILMRRSSDS
eukprot:131943-Lingulodinium_polyedra.AAC.1